MKKIIILLFIVTGLFGESFEYPHGKLGEIIKLGEDILNHTDTNPLSKEYVNSKLQCVNCHRKGEDGRVGTTKRIGTFVATATAFPAYSKRYDEIITLQNRINGCFLRCLGGQKSVINTKVGIAVTTYITWLSEGMKMQMNEKAPRTPLKTEIWSKNRKNFIALFAKVTDKNYKNGKQLYKRKCASCHNINGDGYNHFPALWGKNKKGEWLSYTSDGSMAKLPNSAVWIQENMPFQQGSSLKDSEVIDIVLYINAQERMIYNGVTLEDNFKKVGLDLKKIKTKL